MKVKGVPSDETLDRLASGVYLEEGKTGPAMVRFVSSRDGKSWLEMTLSEGRKREIRRLCRWDLRSKSYAASP